MNEFTMGEHLLLGDTSHARQAVERRLLASGLTTFRFLRHLRCMGRGSRRSWWLPSSMQKRFYVKPGNSFM